MTPVFAVAGLLLWLTASARAADWAGAEWIWQNADGPPNAWVAFRKTVQLSAVPDTALADIAVDSKFWLWVNGELVVFEGGVARGPSPASPWERTPEIWKVEARFKPSNTWYDEVDLRPHLKAGTNTIAVLVWYWGRETNKGTHIDSGKGGLLFQADLGGLHVVSDASWRVKQHPAHAPDSGDNGKSIVPYNVNYDARHDLGDWSASAWTGSNYSDTSWSHAIEKGAPPVAPWHNLEKVYVPRLLNHGLQGYVNYPASRFPFRSTGEVVTCSLPFNQQITPYLEIESPAGQVIEISTDDSRNSIRAFYTTKAGRQAFESYSWMNGHAVKYRIPEGIQVLALKYRWMSVGEMAGSFACSDPFFQRLWWMGRNTLFVCARDNFMDCPDRERAQWIGDVADQASYLFYVMDDAGRQLLKKAIRVTMAFSHQKVYGALGPLRIRELPSQSLQFAFQGIWQYYLNTGDRDTLHYAYPYVHDYLSLWPMQPDGLPQYRKGGSPDSWDWSDWGEKNTEDKEIIQHTLYFMALSGARDMAEELGETGDLAWYNERLSSIQNAFNSKYWTGEYYSSKPGTLHDDRANCLTILSGLASPDKYDAIVTNVLIPNRYCSPHFEWMVEEAMCQAGYYEAALARMKARYRSQVDNPALSTLSEMFPNGGTYNHAWNAPNTILSRAIAGIAPTKPGWREYSIRPNLVDWTWLKQVVPSVMGDITVAIQRPAGQYRMDLESPPGTTVIVGIPKDGGDLSTITANGKTVWAGGVFKEGISGVSPGEESGKYVQFNVQPGQWSFLAE